MVSLDFCSIFNCCLTFLMFFDSCVTLCFCGTIGLSLYFLSYCGLFGLSDIFGLLWYLVETYSV